MIICGDLSVPNKKCTDQLLDDMKSCNIFTDKTVILNMEGVVLQDCKDCFWKVYNHNSVVELKNICSKMICSIANNHTYDYPEYIDYEIELFKKNNIGVFGLFDNESIKPICFVENGVEYAVFGHCWNAYTKTNTNTKTNHHVIDCSYEKFYNVVCKYINNHRSTRVICFFHWNYDLEEFPFPAYKQLAHELIDYGVEAVIGNHAHVPQEIEIYRNKVIAYGLGNFYMPDNYYFNGELAYSEKSHVCYAIELFQDDKAPIQHIFKTDVSKTKALEYIESKELSGGGYLDTH